MDQKTVVGVTLQMNGDTLFNGISTVTLWNLLVASGVLPRQQALNALDAALLVMEGRRETWTADVAIIDQARNRLEILIAQIKTVPT